MVQHAWAAIGARLLEAAPSGLASTSASLPTAVGVGKVASYQGETWILDSPEGV